MPDTTSPILTGIEPAPGTEIKVLGVLRFVISEETDLDLSDIEVEILQAKKWETCFVARGFVAPYRRSGVYLRRTAGGVEARFAIVRDGGWVSNPILRLAGQDVAGNPIAQTTEIKCFDWESESPEPLPYPYVTRELAATDTPVEETPETATMWPAPSAREALLSALWGQETVPLDIYPGAAYVAHTSGTAVHSGKAGLPTPKGTWSSDVGQVDVLICPHGGGGVSTIQFCHPDATPADSASVRNKLLIHVGGHSTHFFSSLGEDLLTYYALRQGIYVLGVSMPTMGFDSSVYTPQEYVDADGDPVVVSNHNFSDVDATCGGLQVFLEGITRALNWLDLQGYVWDSISIVGLSGGGWTSDLYAAIDDRITKSFSVFGSLPFDLRIAEGGPGDDGDWEQLPARAWWDILVDQEHAYALGCLDSGRRRVQILGTGDPTFGVSTVLSEVSEYETHITNAVPTGQHDVHIDTTAASHVISTEARMKVLGEVLDLDPDWTPADLGADLKSWLRADSGVTYNGSNHVTAWTDGASSPPTWTINGTPDYEATGGPTGGPTVSFVASSTEYIYTSTSVNAGSAVRGFIVAKRGSDPPAGAPDIGGLWKYGTADLIVVPHSADGVIKDGFGSTARRDTVNPSDSMASWFVYEAKSTTSEWACYLNGAKLYTTGTNTVSANAEIRLAAGQYGTPAILGNVRICEFLLVGADITEAQEEQIRWYLATKYKLQVKL